MTSLSGQILTPKLKDWGYYLMSVKKLLKVNMSKCTFAQPEVKFLGQIVSEQGCRPDPADTKAIQNMKPPIYIKEGRRFLGMCSFYCKHVPQFALIATPLTNLTHSKVKFRRTNSCQQVFEKLKAILMDAPILVRADISKLFVVTTYASDTNIRGMLSQAQADTSDQAVGYFSKTRYSVTDKEALAVVLICRNFHHYLWGSRFTTDTDHQPLTSIYRKKTKSPRKSRWILEMREFNCKIHYVEGKYNYVTDSLSRPVVVTYHTLEITLLGYTREEMRTLQLAEAKWKEIIEYLEEGKVPHQSYPCSTFNQFVMWEKVLYYFITERDGSVYFCLVVPPSLKIQALEYAHTQAGHQGQ